LASGLTGEGRPLKLLSKGDDMKKLLVVLLLLYPLSASAVTYEWVDEAGTVNFTEDLGKVPKKYRKRAKVIGADESSAPQIIENSDSAKGKPKEMENPKEQKALHPKEEAALRNEYATAKANLRATEQEISDLRARMADTSKMSRSEFLALQNTLKQDEFRVLEQRRHLEQVRQKVQRAGVTVD
jgi:AraC-like DNA-binding protein